MKILIKKDKVSNFYYFYISEISKPPLVSYSTISTNVNIDFSENRLVYGIEFIGGLKFVEQSYQERTIKTFQDKNSLNLVFLDNNEKNNIDEIDTNEENIRNKIKIFMLEGNVIKIQINKEILYSGNFDQIQYD